jgi:SAM-dependent methyltransferase
VSAEASRSVSECPACGATAYERVGRPAAPFDTVMAGRLFRQPAYEIHRCERCDVHYKSSTLTVADLNDYYAVLDSTPFEIEGDFPTDRAVSRMLGKLVPGSRVLDFGCSTGRMLKDFSSSLVCVGVEPNAEAAGIAGRRGIQIVSEDQLRSGAVAPFDAIVLADVYEHLPRPVELTTMLASHLKPGGWLAIVTGNADAAPYRERLSEFWYFRVPGHLHMLSERHASWLAAHLALELDELHRCSHYDTPAPERVRQGVQSWLYHQFQAAPHSVVTSLLRRVPRLRDAERWTTAPALTYMRDHVVARLRKPHDPLSSTTDSNS